MNAVYNWSASWFRMTFSDIPAGYDIVNGQYPGWCVEVSVNMTVNVNHQVRLYSSYGDMPAKFSDGDWDKVNYLINNYQGYSRHAIQDVIWYLICEDPLTVNDSEAQELYTDVNTNGEGFVPTYGEKIVILVDVINNLPQFPVQMSFFEYYIRDAVTLGDLVWDDLNQDGIQNQGEPGLQGITVRLLNDTGATLNTTTTDVYGYYSFSGYTEGNYSVQFVLKSSKYRFSPVNQGSNDSLDSDADRTTGKTPVFTAFASGVHDMSQDAGMYEVEEQGDPGDPGTPVPPPEVPNKAPSADGSAGEPYVALLGEVIWFNGSRSYDSDGTIASYSWTFGDGTTSNLKIANHTYASEGNYSVTLTVTDNDGETDTYTTRGHCRLPNQPPLAPTLTGLKTGSTDDSYVLKMVTTDPNEDNIRYMVSWGDGTDNTTALLNNGQNTQMVHHWASWGYYTIQAYAVDDYANASSGISTLTVAVDVKYVGTYGYLIDKNSDGQYDMFFSNSTSAQTTAEKQQSGVYLIDTNGDNEFDLQYDPSTNTNRQYPESIAPSYTMLLVGLIVVILVLLIIGFLIRRRRWKKP